MIHNVPQAPVTVVLTRPKGKNERLQQRFEQMGLPTISLPALTLRRLTIADPLPELSVFDLVFFVSGFAVDCFFDLLSEKGVHWPADLHAGCVGPGTAQALQRRGVCKDHIYLPSDGQSFDSPGLMASLHNNGVLATLHSVLIACGTTGNPWFADRLRERAISVTRISLYERQGRQWDVQERQQMGQLFENPSIKKYVVITSPQGVAAFVGNLALSGVDANVLADTTTFVLTHASQVSSLQQIWGREIHGANVSALHIVQTFPDDDAIFHTVTISD